MLRVTAPPPVMAQGYNPHIRVGERVLAAGPGNKDYEAIVEGILPDGNAGLFFVQLQSRLSVPFPLIKPFR